MPGAQSMPAGVSPTVKPSRSSKAVPRPPARDVDRPVARGVRIGAGADQQAARFGHLPVPRRVGIGVGPVVTLDPVERDLRQHLVQRLRSERRAKVGPPGMRKDANPPALVGDPTTSARGVS